MPSARRACSMDSVRQASTTFWRLPSVASRGSWGERRSKFAQAAPSSRSTSLRVNLPAVGSSRERLRPAIAERAAHRTQGLSSVSKAARPASPATPELIAGEGPRGLIGASGPASSRFSHRRWLARALVCWRLDRCAQALVLLDGDLSLRKTPLEDLPRALRGRLLGSLRRPTAKQPGDAIDDHTPERDHADRHQEPPAPTEPVHVEHALILDRGSPSVIG